ncbi:MAG: beta-exotoxin transport system permease protein [Thermomicrobiales bacterium]|jgi:ABC-2 type transport system permease protein|nr:beta-exotoxin transport system permease protein [Thermomicrobiales bacterium]
MRALLTSWLWLLRRVRSGLIALLLGVALFELIQPVAIASLGNLTRLDALLTLVPKSFYALMNVTPDFLQAAGLAGYLALGFTHPVYHLLSSATVIWFAGRVLAGEMERGTIQLALSRPVSRPGLYLARVLGLLAVTLAVAVVGPLGMIAGILLANPDGSVVFARFLPTALASALLIWAVGGIALLSSAAADRMGQAVGWVIAALVVSYVIDYFAAIWPALQPLEPLSIFDYYDPGLALSAGTLPSANIVVLATVGLIGTLAGLLVFTRRDLPV